MIDHIRAALSSQIVSGGLLLMATGAVLALLRSIPGRIIAALKRFSIVEVEIRNRRLIEMVTAMMAEAKSRRLRIAKAELQSRNRTPGLIADGEWEEALELQAGYGLHLFRHDGRLILARRSLSKDDGNGSAPGDILLPCDVLSLKTIGRDAAIFRPLLEEALVRSKEKAKKRPELFISRFHEWRRLAGFTWRSFDSVCLPGALGTDLVAEIAQFLASPQRYADLGVPWRFGVLLEGPPGSGKSTLARVLAGEFSLPVYVPLLRGPGCNDGALAELFGNLPPRCIVLLEDVDCVVPARDMTAADTSDGVTLSGLLNVTDGAMAPQGCVMVFTTNRPEALDPALLRPGRVDRRIHLGPATAAQAAQLFLRFHPGELRRADAFGAEMAGQSMAEVQGKLLSETGSPLHLLRAAS